MILSFWWWFWKTVWGGVNTHINDVAGEGMFKIYRKHFSIVIEKVWWWKCSMNIVHSFLQVSVEALISVSGKVYYSSKTKKIFLTRFLKKSNKTKDCHQNFLIRISKKPKAKRKCFWTSWWFDDFLFQTNATRSAGRRRFGNAGDCLEKITGWFLPFSNLII